MSYTDDIRKKLREMHEKSAHEDIHRIMDALKGNEEAMACLLNFVNKWDAKCRRLYGTESTLRHLKERSERGGGYI